MKTTLTLLITLISKLCFAQFDCSNIKLLGIHKNNVNTSQLSILLTNLSAVDDGNFNVYTSLTMINEQGDTILNSEPVFRLPNKIQDTIAYNVAIPEKVWHDLRFARL